jgi:hypothetical protein
MACSMNAPLDQRRHVCLAPINSDAIERNSLMLRALNRPGLPYLLYSPIAQIAMQPSRSLYDDAQHISAETQVQPCDRRQEVDSHVPTTTLLFPELGCRNGHAKVCELVIRLHMLWSSRVTTTRPE